MQGEHEGGVRDSSHYFSPRAGGTDSRREFTLEGSWGALHMSTGGGVFASRGLDRGTEVLLDSLRRHPAPAPPDGSIVVDLGCGSGVLALVMARLWPHTHVRAVDVNDRARKLCALNAENNGLSNVEVCAPDSARPTSISALWSNPPVRIGKQALHVLLSEWLSLLSPVAEARLVVARNLGADPLAQWLMENGWGVERIASARGYRVLVVRSQEDQ